MAAFKKMSISKFLLLLLSIFLGYILLVMFIQVLGMSPNLVYVVQVFFYVVLFYAFFIRGLTTKEMKLMLEKERKTFSGWLMVAPFFIGSLVNTLYVLLIKSVFPGLFAAYQNASEETSRMMGEAGLWQSVLLFIAIVILAPIVEEIIFRGIFFNLLAKKRSALSAMIISSLFFGLLHATTMVPTAVIGFVLCFIYHKTGNLFLAMAAHAFNNFIAFVMPLLLKNTSEVSKILVLFGSLLVLVNIIATILFLRYLIGNWKSLKERTPFYRTAQEENDSSESHIYGGKEKIIDITKSLTHGMSVYPGDPEVRIEETNSISSNGFSLRKLSLSTHSGTHMDFPSHFVETGKTADDIELEKFFGVAAVVSSFNDPIPYGVNFILSKEGYLSLDRAQLFIKNGVQLIGTVHESIEQDYPYPLHKLLLGSDIIILENLELRHVEPGLYQLIVLPLKIEGAEAAPCRAVLMK